MTTGRADRPPLDPLFIARYAIGEDAHETPHECAGYETDSKVHHLGNDAQQGCHRQSNLSTLLCLFTISHPTAHCTYFEQRDANCKTSYCLALQFPRIWQSPLERGQDGNDKSRMDSRLRREHP